MMDKEESRFMGELRRNLPGMDLRLCYPTNPFDTDLLAIRINDQPMPRVKFSRVLIARPERVVEMIRKVTGNSVPKKGE